jgi:hypothetical protein
MAASRARRAPAASKGTLMAARDRFSLRNLYLYLVCLITLIIVIFSAVSLVRGAVELAYPDPNYYGYEAVRTGTASSQRRRSRVASRPRPTRSVATPCSASSTRGRSC